MVCISIIGSGLRKWPSATAFTIMSLSISYCIADEYVLNRTGPLMEPCGMDNVISLSFEYALFTHTLKNLGGKYSLNHFRATSLIPNFFCSTEGNI